MTLLIARIRSYDAAFYLKLVFDVAETKMNNSLYYMGPALGLENLYF